MRQAASWVGTPSIKGRTEATRMALLTFSLIGLQFTWGVEMTYCTPYLLQLGLTKSKTSLVWIAGPLSGLIMQPLVGVITDRSTSKWGRRRPFMIVGSFIVGLFLLVLGWTSEIVGMFISDEDTKKSVTIAVAVFGIYAVDFAINIVQASCRSLIVDTLPIPQQQLGSAWASRMTAVGHLAGYAIGSVDMLNVFGHAFGDTQFKQMTMIAAIFLIFSVAVTSYAVKERVLISVRDSDKKIGAVKILAQLFRTTVNLPPRIQAICWAQFWAWIGWFPFLFYSSTWVGETYFRYEAPKEAAEKSSDTLGDVGRLGSMSLVIFSLVTFISSVVLPFGVLSLDTKKSTFARRPPLGLIRLFNKLRFTRPDLQTAWMISHIVFALAMLFAPVARSVRFATLLVAICGIPWAVTCWAPFAFMGVEINRLAIPSFTRKSSVTMITSATYNRHNSDLSNYDVELEDRGPSILRLNHSHSPDADSDSETDDDDEVSSTGELAGIYLGVLNVYTTLPQFVGTLISWIVFSILEPGTSPIATDGDMKDVPSGEQDDGKWINRHREGPNAIAVCLFVGAVCSLVAAEVTRRLKYAR
ncbi:solute carrier family 45, member 1/2/4 [Blastomyces parvus]|uniref:Solute carrier family 45, member 1/2/4 n=1 Tax=Blastomyces parvus TaxID=2060905 RepID=A0A2B7X342_9EURO|nr:solute carrier family 45, member 1/2/4 [Blastomyces parvus]